MACPPSPTRPTLHRSLAVILRAWATRAANDNAPFGYGRWQAVSAERAALYYASVAEAEPE